MPKETIGPITPASLAFAKRRLVAITAGIEELSRWMEANPDVKELWVWREFSLGDGLRRLESVLPEIVSAIHLHTIGKPQGPNSKKKEPKIPSVASVHAKLAPKAAATNKRGKLVEKKSTKPNS